MSYNIFDSAVLNLDTSTIDEGNDPCPNEDGHISNYENNGCYWGKELLASIKRSMVN